MVDISFCFWTNFKSPGSVCARETRRRVAADVQVKLYLFAGGGGMRCTT